MPKQGMYVFLQNQRKDIRFSKVFVKATGKET